MLPNLDGVNSAHAQRPWGSSLLLLAGSTSELLSPQYRAPDEAPEGSQSRPFKCVGSFGMYVGVNWMSEWPFGGIGAFTRLIEIGGILLHGSLNAWMSLE